jgi:transposase-like protein
MTTKSLAETLKDAGYVRLPTRYVPVEDADMIHYIARKHEAAVHQIKKKWRDDTYLKLPEDDLRKLLDAGVAHSKIAGRYGVHLNSVVRRARQLGYGPRDPGYRETPEAEDVLNDSNKL